MPLLLLLFIVLSLIIGLSSYQIYRTNTERRAREKKRNQYHDRV